MNILFLEKLPKLCLAAMRKKPKLKVKASRQAQQIQHQSDAEGWQIRRNKWGSGQNCRPSRGFHAMHAGVPHITKYIFTYFEKI